MTVIETMLLKDKVVVITGAAGLIGRAFSKGLLREGAKVIVADSNPAQMQYMSDQFRSDVNFSNMVFKRLDVNSKESLVELIESLHSSFGRIDALVNNAYPRNKNYGRKFEQVEYSDFCENLSLHAGGYFLASQQFSAYFERNGGGNIINMASIYGVVAPRFQIYAGTDMTTPIEYAAIKAAILHITRYMAQYFKGKNIRVNCISPGGILDKQPLEFIAAYNGMGAEKGMLEPKDIVGTLIYLVSDMSKFVNGQNIVVDDAWSL